MIIVNLGHSVYLFQVKAVLELHITCVLGPDELCPHDFSCTSNYVGKRVERERGKEEKRMCGRVKSRE